MKPHTPVRTVPGQGSGRPIFRAHEGAILDRSDVPMGYREAAYELYLVQCFAERDIGTGHVAGAKAQLAYARDLFNATEQAGFQRIGGYTWSGTLIRHVEDAGLPSPFKRAYTAFRHYLATHP